MTPLHSNNLCNVCDFKLSMLSFLRRRGKIHLLVPIPLPTTLCHTFTTHMMYSWSPAHSLSKPSTNHLTLLHLQSNGLPPNRENDPSSDWSQGLIWYLSSEQWAQLARFMNSKLTCHDHDQAGAAGQGGEKASLTWILALTSKMMGFLVRVLTKIWSAFLLAGDSPSEEWTPSGCWCRKECGRPILELLACEDQVLLVRGCECSPCVGSILASTWLRHAHPRLSSSQ
jgi:hypothetical protein